MSFVMYTKRETESAENDRDLIKTYRKSTGRTLFYSAGTILYVLTSGDAHWVPSDRRRLQICQETV